MLHKVLGVFIAATFIVSSCTESDTLDKKFKKEDFDQVKEYIHSNEQYSEMKKKFIIDNMSTLFSIFELGGKSKEMDDADLPTYRELMDDLSEGFDSVKVAKIEHRKNNKKLEGFMRLKDANTTPIDEQNGLLSMTLDFNNLFDKEIQYVMLRYKFAGENDYLHFFNKSKLTNEDANNFNGEVEISIKEEDNSVAEFIYNDVPDPSREDVRYQVSEGQSFEDMKKEFLMEGLEVAVLEIVFKDESKLGYENAKWDYFEDEEQ